MTDAIRTCISCAHFKGAENIYPVQPQQNPECTHPKAASRDLLYGKAFCANERNTQKGCGKKGKLWASKESANKS